ncbi:MAG: triose-phosphate isomerase, partial [candidate division Zixibacteria bacterium]|nr:triose-phosphate isomerase [candidate division Zixibacteria bacterium]
MKSSSRKSLFVANWKMNKTPDEAARYVERLHSKVGQSEAVDVFIAPPFVALYSANRALRWSKIKLAAQDISEFESGAYTGEVSAAMLLAAGCHGVIIGHSERRRLFGDSDERVGLKVNRALRDGLFPIICIGETEREREKGQTEEVLSRQIAGALSGFGEERELLEKSDFALAYEPVWAIGTGKAA